MEAAEAAGLSGGLTFAPDKGAPSVLFLVGTAGGDIGVGSACALPIFVGFPEPFSLVFSLHFPLGFVIMMDSRPTRKGVRGVEPFGAVIFLSWEEGSPSLLLDPIFFDPAALWLRCALERAGVTRFLVLGAAGDLEAAGPCFPQGTVFVPLGSKEAGRAIPTFLAQVSQAVIFTRPVFLDDRGARTLTDGSLPKGEDAGAYRISASVLAGALTAGQDLPSVLRRQGGTFGVRPGCFEGLLPLDGCVPTWDSAQDLARYASVARLQGECSTSPVRFIDKQSVYIGPQVTVGGGTTILPGTILRGRTVIGRDCEVGPHAMVRDCVIGDRVTVNASQLNESTVDDDTTVGPFAYVRPNCHVGKQVKVGDFVELKNSTVGDGTKISHLTYVGDTDAGRHINFGCGTVTVNYDGKRKFRTVIEDGAFIGCNTNLVAPVTVGAGAYTAAGSTITKDVPADALGIARDRQSNLPGWAAKRREKG